MPADPDAAPEDRRRLRPRPYAPWMIGASLGLALGAVWMGGWAMAADSNSGGSLLVEVNGDLKLVFWILTAVCFFGSFVCAVLEESLHHASRPKLLELMPEDARRRRFEELLAREDQHRLATHIARDLFLLATFLFAAAGASDTQFELDFGALAVVAVSLYVGMLLFNKALAGYLGQAWGERVLVALLPAADQMVWPLWPAIALVRYGQRKATTLFGASPRQDDITAELIHIAERAEDEGVLDKGDKAMLEKLVYFKDMVVSEVMTPRTEMVSVEVNEPLVTAMETAMEHGYSRLPVYEGDRDHIVGVLNTRDLLPLFVSLAAKERNLPTVRELLRPPYFVPEGKDVGDLLSEMSKRKISMAVVLDEYAGTAGVVTVEDIIEEIVGEIHDEFDDGAEERIRPISEHVFDVDARVRIDELNEKLDLRMPEDQEYETLGGYLFFVFGAIPKTGDTTEAFGCRFVVTDSEARRVKRVRVEQVVKKSDNPTSVRTKAAGVTAGLANDQEGEG